jgi:hypothetical protein
MPEGSVEMNRPDLGRSTARGCTGAQLRRPVQIAVDQALALHGDEWLPSLLHLLQQK